MATNNWQKEIYYPPLLPPYRLGFRHGQRYPANFGKLAGSRHLGQDYIVPVGRPLYAIAGGFATSSKGKDGGNTIRIVTTNGLSVRYMHLSQFAIQGRVVSGMRNQVVSKGDIIGYSGNTGVSTAPHLHLDIYNGLETNINRFENFINPLLLTYSTNMARPNPNPNPGTIDMDQEFDFSRDYLTRVAENYEILIEYARKAPLFLLHRYGFVDGNADWNGKNFRTLPTQNWALRKSKEQFRVAIERDYQDWRNKQ